MYLQQGRVLRLLTLTTLCASMLTACNQSLFQKKDSQPVIVQASAQKNVINSSKVIDFKIIATQNMSHGGTLSLTDIAKQYPQLSDNALMLASVDQVLETDAGTWEFYANFKLLFTLASDDRVNLQVINNPDPMFSAVTVNLNARTKMTESIRFNLLDCQYASTADCDVIDAVIHVHTRPMLNGEPRTDQDQDQTQDKDQDVTQDKDQDVTQDKDQDKDQDTDQDQNQDGSDPTPTT